MRRLTPKSLVLAGVVAVAFGAVATMGLAVAQTSCQNWQGPDQIDPTRANHCAGWAWGARVGFVILLVGGLLILIGAIRATPLYRDRADPPSGEEATGAGPPGEETPLGAPREAPGQAAGAGAGPPGGAAGP